MNIVWNRQAKNNLEEIRNYYQDADAPANKFEYILDGILSALDRLERSPRSGRMVPEIGDPNFREVIWNNWRINYLLPKRSTGTIETLNVIHSVQQFGGPS
jgi:plasmid stabilization system protein ParE